MPAKLSTHALDTYHGKPAAGLLIQLFRLDGRGERTLLKTSVTNSDGRTDAPFLEADQMQEAIYELVFAVGDYFKKTGVPLAQTAFLDEVPVRFTIADSLGSYHVPLVFTPWAYSTYRGS